jgi:hypothetical protein
MNLTIWSEVAAAALAFIAVVTVAQRAMFQRITTT